MTTTPPPEGTTEPRCEHTEHATRGDGRYGRHFETADPAGAWEPCPSPPVSAAAPKERKALYVDIANRAQEITGRGIWPSTVKAVLEVAASVSAAAPKERADAIRRADALRDALVEVARERARADAAEAALAARPAPIVSGERGAMTLADAWDEGWRACAGSAGSASPHHNGPANPYRTVADTPAADDEGGQER